MNIPLYKTINISKCFSIVLNTAQCYATYIKKKAWIKKNNDSFSG